MILRTLAPFVLPLAVVGCTTVTPMDYRGEQPTLDLVRYFDGTIDGWGMVQDRSGKVMRRFHVVIEARWAGSVGTLDETFAWSDGGQEKRVWTLTKVDANRYTGTAGDVVGTAQGEAHGNALQWRYVLKLPEAQGGWEVDLDDWMYLVDERIMLNRSVIRKFGIRFGDITIAFRKRA